MIAGVRVGTAKQNIDYTLLEILGEGRNSCVFKAIKRDRKNQLSQVVAAKILRSKTLVETWRKELESHFRVDSKYCVSLYGWDWIQNKPALILEHVEGCSLGELTQNFTIVDEQVDEICRQIQNGVADLDQQGLCHGDLSLSNILVNTKGQIKLIDFGLGNTDPKALHLTPKFAAPEVVDGQPPNYSSDLYSIGAIRLCINGGKDLCQCATDLMCPRPDKRSPRQYQKNIEVQKKLGLMVRYYLGRKKLKSNGTVKMTNRVKNPTTRASEFASLLSMIALGLIFNATQDVYSQVPNPTSLNIKTRRWLFINFDGEDAGYTPIKLERLSPGAYNIKYRCHRGSSSRTLTIERGQHILLTDQDFNC